MTNDSHEHAPPPGVEIGSPAWGEWVKDYYRDIETYDWVEAADRIQGLETFFHRKRSSEAAALFRRYGNPAAPVLDAGCGTGLITRHLPIGTIGLDLNPRHVSLASRRLPAHRFVVGDVENLPFPDGSFGTVVCTEVIEHIPFPERALAEFARVLRPGGVLIGMTPARSAIWKLRFLSRTCPHAEPFHNNYSTAEVVDMLTVAGLTPTSLSYSFLRFSVQFVAEQRAARR